MSNHLLAALAVLSVSTGGSALAQDRLDWGDGYGRPVERLVGPGVRALFPELRDSPRGRIFVMRNFDFNHDGRIGRAEADAANRAFAREAGPSRSDFDWGARDRRFEHQDMTVPTHGWDRARMHDYHFRQTSRGATFTLAEDVLFATDSDALRPGAIEKLRPLSAYLQDQGRVSVSIDGYTDSRGSDAHNQDLSERRARSVRDALEAMGGPQGRFQVAGHGEQDPVATNETEEGRRQNRRVEITLLGQQARIFDR